MKYCSFIAVVWRVFRFLNNALLNVELWGNIMSIYWRETALVHRQGEPCDWPFLTASSVCCRKEWGKVHTLYNYLLEKCSAIKSFSLECFCVEYLKSKIKQCFSANGKSSRQILLYCFSATTIEFSLQRHQWYIQWLTQADLVFLNVFMSCETDLNGDFGLKSRKVGMVKL